MSAQVPSSYAVPYPARRAAKVAEEAKNVRLVGRWPYGPAFAVVVQGRYAYLGSGGAVLVLDISDPSSPRKVGECVTPGIVEGLFVSGDYLYVADYKAGLRIIDISDPSFPMEVGAYDTPGYAKGVHVSGSYAYVADWDEGLRVIDISDPSSPMELGAYDTPGLAKAVHVSGSYAYVADGEAGLRVIDISDPYSPREVGAYDTPGYARGVHVSGSYAYVADEEAGLIILEFLAPGPHIHVSATSHNFGSVSVGSYSEWSFSIRNLGSANLTVSSVSSDNPAFEVVSPEFPQDISPEGSLEVKLRFSPTEAKSYAGTITIESNDPDQPSVSVSLSGEGVAPVSVSLPDTLANPEDTFVDNAKVMLGKLYPNPFNSMVVIPFSVSHPGEVEVAIYNLKGQVMWEYDGWFAPGWHRLVWDGRDMSGRKVGSGIYLVMVAAEDRKFAEKVAMVR